jgi:hypothetical protein
MLEVPRAVAGNVIKPLDLAVGLGFDALRSVGGKAIGPLLIHPPETVSAQPDELAIARSALRTVGPDMGTDHNQATIAETMAAHEARGRGGGGEWGEWDDSSQTFRGLAPIAAG